MGNHDLLSDDDFFAKSRPDKDKKERTDKKKDVYSEEEEFFKSKDLDDSLFEIDEIEAGPQEQPDSKQPPKQQAPDFFEGFDEKLKEKEDFPKDQPLGVGAPAPPRKDTDLKYKKVYFDIDDDKQEKINYKPAFIGILIVVLLLAGGISIYYLFFAKKTAHTEIVIAEPETMEQSDTAAPSREEIRRRSMLAGIAGRTNHELSSLGDIINTTSKSVKLSSALLYNSDLLLEVYASNRDELARLNMNLKSTFKNKPINIISSSQRPGENAGILGLYSLKLDAGSAQKEVSNRLGSQEAEQWLRNLLSRNNLKSIQIKSRSLPAVDAFSVYQIEAAANGSFNDCLMVINNIAAAGSNVELHKLSWNAVDQKSFSPANYQLRLVLKIYV